MLLIADVIAVTMDETRRIVTSAAIAIENGRIVDLGKSAGLRGRYPNAEVIEGHGMVAIPGLIDCHGHADQSLLRGLGDAMHWMPFLDEVIGPYLGRRDPSDAVTAYQLSLHEMLRSGTTCFVSPNVDPRDDFYALTEAIGALGIRAVLARFVVPKPEPDSRETAKTVTDEAIRDITRWNGSAGGLVQMWFGAAVPRRPGEPYHPHYHEAMGAAAKALGIGIVYHFCSEIEDSFYFDNEFGMRPTEWSRANHLLGPNILPIGGCWMTPAEIRIMADTGTPLVHSPTANMKMATGVLPLPDVLEAGVTVALGTDGALNNNTHDMFAEMKVACLLQNSVRHRAGTISPETALEMATINGAKALGREHELGSLEKGKLADIVLLDMRRPQSMPAFDVVSNLVFATNPSNVDTVIVGGRVVVKGGKVIGIDEAELYGRAERIAERLAGALRLKPHSSWPRE